MEGEPSTEGTGVINSYSTTWAGTSSNVTAFLRLGLVFVLSSPSVPSSMSLRPLTLYDANKEDFPGPDARIGVLLSPRIMDVRVAFFGGVV